MSLRERDSRYRNIRVLMAEREFDGLVICGSPWMDRRGYVRYVSNHLVRIRFNYVVFPIDGEPIGVGWPTQLYRAWEGEWIKDVRPFTGTAVAGEASVASVVKAIKDLKLEEATIGLVGYDFFPTPTYRLLLKNLPKATFKPADHVLNEARMVKSPEEIRLVEKTADLTDKAFETFVNVSSPGKSEREVYAEVCRTIISQGAECQAINILNASGVPLPPQHPPSDRRLKAGDSFQFCPEFAGPGGYWVHCGRVVSLGKPMKEMLQVWDRIVEIQREGIKSLKPGKTGADVYKAYANVAKEAGYELGANAGHGMGLDCAEEPFITSAEETILKPGMVIGTHPAKRTKPPHFDFMLADTYLITKNGARQLTKTSAEYRIIQV